MSYLIAWIVCLVVFMIVCYFTSDLAPPCMPGVVRVAYNGGDRLFLV